MVSSTNADKPAPSRNTGHGWRMVLKRPRRCSTQSIRQCCPWFPLVRASTVQRDTRRPAGSACPAEPCRWRARPWQAGSCAVTGTYSRAHCCGQSAPAAAARPCSTVHDARARAARAVCAALRLRCETFGSITGSGQQLSLSRRGAGPRPEDCRCSSLLPGPLPDCVGPPELSFRATRRSSSLGFRGATSRMCLKFAIQSSGDAQPTLSKK